MLPGSDVIFSHFVAFPPQAPKSRPQRGRRVQYNLISDDSDDSDFMMD